VIITGGTGVMREQISEKADHLAGSRTTDQAKAADISRLLQHWMIHGKPARTVGSG